LVSEANSNLSRYNGALSHLINPSLLLTTFATKEAVLSSRIEGTQASLEDVLQKDSKKHDENKRLDIEEIENCKKALENGAEDLKNRPLCLNLIKDIHSILLNGVRGHNKDRGNFRKIENWIGFVGATKDQASYIPPSPDKMVIALDNWEKYIHLESEEILIQLAVIHAQFEIIHPFLDGNGRIGRILIPLFLYAKKYLDFPAFYMSEYLESCRSEYYARLKNISENNDWQGWIEFFLRAIIEQSKISKNRVDRVLELYNKIKYIIPKTINSKYLPQIIDILFEKPILEVDYIAHKIPTIDKSTAIRILNKLSEPIEYAIKKNYEINLFEHKKWQTIEKVKTTYAILKKHEGQGSKPSSYEFVELLNIIENRV
jgi:Fic family protein